MRSVRTLRTGTVVAVMAWKLAALALLPVAFCCQAALAADDGALHACCEGGEHGATCPMKRSGRDGGDPDPQEGRPRLVGCNPLDDALVGLLGLTGFTLDAVEWTADLHALERVTDVHPAVASRNGAPSPPPPRA